MWGSKPGSFYHPADTWSTTVGEAEEHARFHAVDDGPGYDHYDYMEFDEACEQCGSTKGWEQYDETCEGIKLFRCLSCGEDQEDYDGSGHPEWA